MLLRKLMRARFALRRAWWRGVEVLSDAVNVRLRLCVGCARRVPEGEGLYRFRCYACRGVPKAVA